VGEGRYVGIDPGTSKCGYAVLSSGGDRLALEVIPADQLPERVAADIDAGVNVVCVGDATRSNSVMMLLRARWPTLRIALVDERNTSLQARRRYYEDHPPRGILRLVPRGLLVPKVALDGYAALLIIERYLAGLGSPERRKA
jgi:RNase H-fold protein (predicted Holliday junction resolvase)